MELPRSLAPWAPWLELFPADVQGALGALVRRVAAELGPLRIEARRGDGEPDGFDGLANRGPYDRMLASEWALADDLPDEFARRVAMGEQVFYRIARRDPAKARCSVGIFDGGPNQLGAPRLGHLALLIALARRAEAAGAWFVWGALQDESTHLQSVVTADSVHQLLGFRTAIEADARHAERWMERVAGIDAADECWVIGGRRLSRLTLPGSGRVIVDESPSRSVRSLTVSVSASAGAIAEAILELPGDEICARLLRDPFQSKAAKVVRHRAAFKCASNLIFSSDGRKLIARSADPGAVVVYPVSGSPREPGGPPKLARADGSRIVAAGSMGRCVVLVTRSEDGLHVTSRKRHRANLSGAYSLPPVDSFADPPEDQLLEVKYVVGERQEYLAIVDANGVLWVLARGEFLDENGRVRRPGGSARQVARGVISAAQPVESLAFIARPANGSTVERCVLGSDVRVRPLGEREGKSAFIGYGGSASFGQFGLLAEQVETGRWTLTTSKHERRFVVGNEATVVGCAVVPSRDSGTSAEFLVLLERQRDLILEGVGHRETILTAPAPVSSVVVGTAKPVVAFATATGAVFAYSLTERAYLNRFEFRGDPS